MGTAASDTATLSFSFSGSYSRYFEVFEYLLYYILYNIYWTMECFTLYLIQVNLSFIGQSNPNQVFKWISVSYDSFCYLICQSLKGNVKQKISFFFSRFPGCLQYFEGLTGRVETFNYPNCVNTQSHLPSQE